MEKAYVEAESEIWRRTSRDSLSKDSREIAERFIVLLGKTLRKKFSSQEGQLGHLVALSAEILFS
jgi:hypothetical protein